MLAALVLAAPASAADARYWSVAKVMRSIDGARIDVGTRVVRVESDTALCSGSGGSRRVRGVRVWRVFFCTYTTFTKRGIGPDLEFSVRPVSARRFVITGARWVSG